jgi:hypothetical protein
MPLTIGNVIDQKKQSDAAASLAYTAAQAADQAFADAQARAVSASQQLKVGLGRVGPVFIQSTDGAVEIWMPDASTDGYHVFKPVDVGTVLEADPPAPEPTQEQEQAQDQEQGQDQAPQPSVSDGGN